MEKEKIQLKKCVEISYVDWSGCFHLKMLLSSRPVGWTKSKKKYMHIIVYYCWIVVSFLLFIPYSFFCLFHWKKKKWSRRPFENWKTIRLRSCGLIRFSSAFLRLLHAAAAAAVLPIYIYFLSVILYNKHDNEEYAARETVPERHASLDSWMTFSSRCCCCCLLGDTLTKKNISIEENIFM